MIFVTLGSSKIAPMYAFAREMDEVAERLHDEVIMQYGITQMNYRHLKATAYYNSMEMLSLLKQAEIVISHGGWGNLSQCITLGKRLIAIPRKQGVEVNHDQEQLIRKLEELHCLIGVYNLADLEKTIELAREFEFRPLQRGSVMNILLRKFTEWNIPQAK